MKLNRALRHCVGLVLTFVLANTEAATLDINPATQLVEVVSDVEPTFSVKWDRIVQSFVIDTKVGPTVASAAYGALHTAIYNAWAEYTPGSEPTLGNHRYREIKKKPKDRRRAMTYAAYAVLADLFPEKVQDLKDILKEMGMEKIKGPPYRIGKYAANRVLHEYAKSEKTDRDESPWQTDPTVTEVDLWREEHVPIDDLNGPLQSFLTPEHGRLKTFGVKNGASYRPPPPKKFLANGLKGTVDMEAKTLTLEGEDPMPITKDLIGDVIDRRFIQQCREVLKYSRQLDDKNKIIAEFWEDAGGTSFPPGTWMTFGQFVSARDDHTMAQDVKMFLALGNAVRDAGIASWNAKRNYYYTRPVRAIRDLGSLGLLGKYNETEKDYVVKAYNMAKQKAEYMLPQEWDTYQTPGSHPSPPFPEYTSGHSCFSGAAATVLKAFTGSDDFNASVEFLPGSSRFEPGVTPQNKVTLSWKTFRDAADEAGDSRLHGGIHFKDGNEEGKKLGYDIGQAAFDKAKEYFDGNKK